ncbi:MAG: F0F1 ATP synthase subunit epsilon, partial [Pirellulaceae bacterium]
EQTLSQNLSSSYVPKGNIPAMPVANELQDALKKKEAQKTKKDIDKIAEQIKKKHKFVHVIGIAPAHSPLIGRLGFGEMRVRQGSQVKRFYVDGGFVQVRDNVVSVLTNRAVPVAEVDAEQAREQLEQALQRKANTPELMAARDRLIAQARGQLWVTRS